MPSRSRDNLGNFLWTTSTISGSQPSLFFSDCELEDPLGEQPEIFEEPIVEEEEETIPPTYTMTKNINGIEDIDGAGKRTERALPIRETNGDSMMKNTSPSSLPHFHVLTSEDLDTFLFEFVVICRTHDYTFHNEKLKFFPSTLKDAALL